MAFAMVISLMPMALAAEGDNTQSNTGVTGSDNTNQGGNTDNNQGSGNQGGNNQGGGNQGGSGQTPGGTTTPENPPAQTHTHSESETWTSDDSQHWKTCTDKDCPNKEEKLSAENHTYGDKYETSGTQHWQKCTVCGHETDKTDHNITWTITPAKHTGTCSECKQEINTKHTFGNDLKCTVCGFKSDKTADSISSNSKISLKEGESATIANCFTVLDGDGNPTDKYGTLDYIVDDRDGDADCISIKSGKVTGIYDGTAYIYVYDGNTRLGYITVEVKGDSQISVSATVYTSTSSYCLDDTDDAGGKSVVDQLEDKCYNKSKNWYGLEYVSFSRDSSNSSELDIRTNRDYYADDVKGESYYLSEVILTPSNKKSTATFPFTASIYTSDSYSSSKTRTVSGTLTIEVKEGSATSGDIEYTATAGKDVTFDAKSFDDFWTDEYSSGILDYVTFSTSSSNGTLYDEDGSKLSSSSKCYYDPSSSRQIDLDGVYFEPKSSKAGTVKISFTAYGLNKKNGTDKELSGTVVITYLNGDIDDITYKPGANGKVDLVAKDFTDVFKAATGSSTSSLTITFTSLPDNGTLTYGSRDTKVTKSTTFKTSGSGNKISDVTYTASGSRSDTITYTAASGSTKITGKIIFNPTPANISLQVPYTCTSANGVTFSPADFTSRASALGTNYSLAFAQPTNGGLYYAVIGSQIPAGTKIPVSTLNTVTYRPAANGTVSITFIIYDASGTLAGSGTVTITVTGVTTTPTNPTNPTTPGTTTPTVNDFRDVAADAWYRNDLSRLVNLGVVSGVTSSKFEPLGELNYGAALKLICKAVDVTQPEASGAQWAINYKNYAVQQGWITSDVDLTATIYRTEVAQIAAKALNLSPSSAKPFADSNDPYVAAMNAAGIIRGNDSGLFKGESSLRRSEICAIVCRMLDYRANSFNNEKPGWL